MQLSKNPSINCLLNEARFFTAEQLAKRNERECVVCVITLYAVLTATTLGVLPAYVLIVAPVLYARYLLGGHEVLHSPWGPNVHVIMRLMPFCQSLFTLGYLEYRNIHLRHHRYLGTKDDPEDYLVSASGTLHALARAFIAPERTYIRWLQQKGMSQRLAYETLIRTTIFVGFLWANPSVFLVFFGIMRLSILSSEFFFHHVLHMNDLVKRQHWVYESVPDFWWPLLRILIGSAKVAVLLEHDVHHRYQRITSGQLAAARLFLAEKQAPGQGQAS